MKSLLTWTRKVVLLLAFALPAQAGTTWIVDVNGGPGVNFTDIPAAIAAASSGDVILVHSGVYSPFTLTKGLTIIGKLGTYPTGTYIRNVIPGYSNIAPSAGETAVLADLYFNGEVRMLSAAGVVITDRLDTRGAGVFGHSLVDTCADVRIHRHIGGSFDVYASRVEIASSNLQAPGTFGNDGRTALYMFNSSGVVTRTSCIGSDGLNVPIGLPGNGGNGGCGIQLVPGAVGQPLPTLLLAGGGVSTIKGGGGGFTYFQNDGYDADGLYNFKCGVWRSGCTFIAGNHVGSGAVPIHHVPGPGSFDAPITPDDPTLELVGTPIKGGTVQLNVYATPGSVVRLTLGNTPVLVPTPGVRVDKLVSPDETLFLGVVPASGVISQTIYFRRAFTTGMAFYAQAFMFDNVAGETRRTNSVPLIMR